jgi:hypothetical protein
VNTLNVRMKCCGGCLDIRKPNIKRVEEVTADVMRFEYWPCLHSARYAEYMCVNDRCCVICCRYINSIACPHILC